MQRRSRRPIATGGGESLIDAFNRDNALAAMLERYGYERSPRHREDWRSPIQTSGSFATRIIDGGKWISLSQSDASAGVGEQCSAGCFGDAFDLFVHFEHGGDAQGALSELRSEREIRESWASQQPPPEHATSTTGRDDAVAQVGLGPSDRPKFSATPFAWPDPVAIPPRRWLLGYWLLRGEITAIVAPGGLGKSTLTVGMALSLASGREILKRTLHEGAAKVWLWNLEDDRSELDRQVTACSLHHGAGPSDCSDRLFVDSGLDMALCTAIEGSDGFKIIEPVFDALKEEIERRKIDALILDPFVSSHQVTENDNVMIDKIAKRWKRLATETGIAVVLVHHSKKLGGREVKAEDSRGAVALINAARSTLVLNPMTKDEGEAFGVQGMKELRRFIRVDDDKPNRAPPQSAAWFRKASVQLGNRDQYDRTDDVGAIEPWTPPDAFDGISVRDLYDVQMRIKDGDYGENSQAGDWAGHVVADVIGADLENKTDKARVKSLLRQWTENKAFAIERRDTGKGRKKPFLVVGKMVDPTEIPTSAGGVGKVG